jgi:hypothetical protein
VLQGGHSEHGWKRKGGEGGMTLGTSKRERKERREGIGEQKVMTKE